MPRLSLWACALLAWPFLAAAEPRTEAPQAPAAPTPAASPIAPLTIDLRLQPSAAMAPIAAGAVPSGIALPAPEAAIGQADASASRAQSPTAAARAELTSAGRDLVQARQSGESSGGAGAQAALDATFERGSRSDEPRSVSVPEAAGLAAVHLERRLDRGPPVSADPPLDQSSLRQLEDLSRLSPEDFDGLLDRFEKTKFEIPGKVPLSEHFTFSLELEFLVNRQLSEHDVTDLKVPGEDPLTPDDLDRWREERFLPKKYWVKARALAIKRVIDRLPAGWKKLAYDFHYNLSQGNVFEPQTGSGGKGFHDNTAEDWSGLVSGLKEVQKALPGGVYTVHIHVGMKEATIRSGPRKRVLSINQEKFARMAKGYEGLWRALSGLGFAQPRNPGNSWDLELLPPRSLWADQGSQHNHIINLSETFPTIETKIITGLLRNGKVVDAEALKEELWWTFAFMRAVSASSPVPVTEIGLPMLAGARPTRAQLAHALDLVYGGDPVGKAIALKRLAGLRNGQSYGEQVDPAGMDAETVAKGFRKAGLAQVYELHARHGGWDDRLEQHLLEPERFARLASDLRAAGAEQAQIDEYFPAVYFSETFRSRLTEALIQPSLADRLIARIRALWRQFLSKPVPGIALTPAFRAAV